MNRDMYNYSYITYNYNLVPIETVLYTGRLGTEKDNSFSVDLVVTR